MENNEHLIKPSALKDWAYELIKKDILNFRSPPGSLLHINELVKKLQISRTPIREALLKLQNEGLVRAESRVGFFVSELSEVDLRDLFELKALLEGYAAEIAAPLLTEDDVANMEQQFEICCSALESGQYEPFVSFDKDFHNMIIERAPNARLKMMMEIIEDLTYRERLLALGDPEHLRVSMEEHKEIIKALRQRDGQLAGRLVRGHYCAVRERLGRFLTESS